jgi:hypothetical protein
MHNLANQMIKGGYLQKQGARRKNWKNRYFLLTGSDLTYYVSEAECKDPALSKGAFDILDSKIDVFSHNEAVGKSFCIQIGLKTIDRTVFLLAKSMAECFEWARYLLVASKPSDAKGFPVVQRDLSGVAGPLDLADIDNGWKNTMSLHEKIAACVRMYDWTVIGTEDDSPHREEKRNILLELVEFCKSKNDAFLHPFTLPLLVRMIAANLFRALPPREELPGEDDDDDEPYTNPSWPEMSVTYELLLQIVLTDKVDTKAKKAVFDQNFILQLLELFDSGACGRLHACCGRLSARAVSAVL